MKPFTPQDLQAETGITNLVLERLMAYATLLEKWQKHKNLVSGKTLAHMWRRHYLDSAQLEPLIPRGPEPVLDLGSGAGFPGLVLAVMGVAPVHLVESEGKKCAFLAEANRITGANAIIHHSRIEELEPLKARAVVSRACAPLPQLLEYAKPLMKPGGICLFLKGNKVGDELTESEKGWTMSVTRIDSRSDPSGTILKIEEISPRHGP